MFLRKGFLKVCCKFTGEHPCQSVISIKLLRNFIEIALRHGCSPVNLLNIFRTPFPMNTSGWLLLSIYSFTKYHLLLMSKTFPFKNVFYFKTFPFQNTYFCIPPFMIFELIDVHCKSFAKFLKFRRSTGLLIDQSTKTNVLPS